MGIGTGGEVRKKKTMGKVSETKSWGLLAFEKPAVLGSVEGSVCGEKRMWCLTRVFLLRGSASVYTHTHTHTIAHHLGWEKGVRVSSVQVQPPSLSSESSSDGTHKELQETDSHTAQESQTQCLSERLNCCAAPEPGRQNSVCSAAPLWPLFQLLL